ncbi:MAG: endolytic transglycosylase MltG [Bacteroidetes bacterium]|nr:endolytic transglycosylase MltG [Bacteroidota bacterium]
MMVIRCTLLYFPGKRTMQIYVGTDISKFHFDAYIEGKTIRLPNRNPKPGIASIEAALEPEKHDYIYFVATGDGDHTFSKTYTQHLKAVELYRLKRKK